MSQGKKKTKIVFCTLWNPVEHPGCLIPPRKAAAAFIGRLSMGRFSVKQYTAEVTQTGLGLPCLGH